MANEVIKSSSMLQITSQFIERLNKFSEATNLKFGNYEKVCVSNAIRVIDPILSSNNVSWYDLDVNNVYSVLQQTAFLRLNPSSTPGECYFIVRKNWDKKANRPLPPTLEFGIEGVGNDAILRNFGVDVKTVASHIIFEGDDYDLGEVNGWEITLPRYSRKGKSNKVLYVYYLVKKIDGDTEVLIASREDVKVSLISQARNNLRGFSEEKVNKIIDELSELTLDEILKSPKWMTYKINKEYGKNTVESPLLGPAWTNREKQESMIQRKIRNHATRRYPKNFDPELQRLYEDTFEDEKYKRENVIEAEETIENAQVEYEETSSKETIEEPKAEKVKEEKPKKKSEPKTQKPKVAKEKLDVVEETGEDIEKEEVDSHEVEEEQAEEVEQKEVPDWF